MLAFGGKADDVHQGKQCAEMALKEGRGWEKFRQLVIAQGGDVSYVDKPEKLPRALLVELFPATRSGYLREVNAHIVGETVVGLGGGRSKKGDPIDHAVGVVVHKKVGDRVEAGEALFTIHANGREKLEAARQRLQTALQWSDERVDPLPLFYGVVK
jgi:pyrimidine-nucleoside phosphorylase